MIERLDWCKGERWRALGKVVREGGGGGGGIDGKKKKGADIR